MQVISIAECSKGSFLHYFQPLLSYHLSLRSLFCLFLNGCFTQVLFYVCNLAKFGPIFMYFFLECSTKLEVFFLFGETFNSELGNIGANA